ncbi:MAG: type ISP restriction/modification enzyme [Pseudomonadota bacterium]
MVGASPGFLAAFGTQRKAANRIKREESITVVIGNPPYKEKAKGRGGWIEGDGAKGADKPPLMDWMPPAEWGLGAHAKHLRNLYVYFWRWATWKVFDHPPKTGAGQAGIVAYITVAGFLSGPGFERMREHLRQRCDELWVIDCSPEGHQPEVATRIFQGVQQPVCIVIASRWRAGEKSTDQEAELARVRWRALPEGRREAKFEALKLMALDGPGWVDCPSEGRAPFLPASGDAWASYPALQDYFDYNGTGVMAGRTWIAAPDAKSLRRRWARLVSAPAEQKETLFHPHLRGGKLGDKHSMKLVASLPGFVTDAIAVAAETGEGLPPVAYGHRSFDRQWVLPDARLINQPNNKLWASRSEQQVYLTAPEDRPPTGGPGLTISASIPDVHHYNGRGGRVLPLWADAAATIPNLHRPLLAHLATAYGQPVGAEDLFAYIVALAAHPAYVDRFRNDLATPGLRVPLTADAETFFAAAALGRRVVWLHSFGERMADPAAGRPSAAPRLPPERQPKIPAGGAIPSDPDHMPDTIDHDAATQCLYIGAGRIAPVPVAVWRYEVSGKQVLTQWFSYRRKTRDRPLIGDRRKPSPLGEIQPEAWLAEYTTELLDLLNVLGLLVELEPEQAAMLDRALTGEKLPRAALLNAGALPRSSGGNTSAPSAPAAQPQLF